MTQAPLLSILILNSQKRDYKDLLALTIQSLLYHLNYPLWELIIYSHSGGIIEGYEKLFASAKGKYIFQCQDDYFFFPTSPQYKNWIQTAINILEENPEVKFVRLRVDHDGQVEGPKVKEVKGGEIVSHVGFTLNPWIAKPETIQALLDNVKSHPEDKNSSLEEKMFRAANRLDFNTTAKLVFPEVKCSNRGICIHTGYGRRQKKDQ
jgi:hypothetical protein